MSTLAPAAAVSVSFALRYLFAGHGHPLQERNRTMDWKIELVFIPVTDVDRAKHFYVEQVGFHADHDQTVSEEIRFVQLTPPGSACSIAFGRGLTEMVPGTQRGVQVVVTDADEARAHLVANGVACSEVDDQPWGRFVTFDDPDGNGWILQQLPAWAGQNNPA